MVWSRFLYDAFLALYAMSIIGFFMDAVQPRRSVNRTAVFLLFTVFLLETLFFLQRLRISGMVPLYTTFDAMLLLSWLIVLVTLVLNAFFRIDLLLFLANTLGFTLAVFTAFGPHGDFYPAPQGDLLLLHIVCALLSYAAFSFAFIFSLMYLVQERFLREKRWNRWYFRLPALEHLDRYAFRAILFGFPLLLIAIVLGAIWGKLTMGRIIFMDPKLLGTTLLWMMYGVYLLLRARNGWGRLNLIRYNVLCFSGVIVNFAVLGSFSLLHRGV